MHEKHLEYVSVGHGEGNGIHCQYTVPVKMRELQSRVVTSSNVFLHNPVPNQGFLTAPFWLCSY